MQGYLDVKQASKYVGLSIPRIYAITTRNEIEFFSQAVGKSRRIYFLKADLDKFLQDRKLTRQAVKD